MHSSWTLESGYPKVDTNSSNGMTVKLRYYAKPYANILNNVPEDASQYPAERIENNGEVAFTDFILDKYSIAPGETNAVGYINLTYKSADQNNFASTGIVVDREIRCTFNDDGLVKPIESHPNYRTNWNYAVIVKEGATEPANVDSFWTDNANQILTEADAKIYKWIKASEQVPTGWWLAYDATKPGQENYIISAPIITHRQFFRREKDVEAAAKLVGTHFVPDKTYGKSTDASHWLVPGGVSIEPEDGWYILTVRCQYADSWDNDLYSGSS